MKILFVCTGNTCRSCMAEAIFDNLCTIKGIKAYSAGIAALPNSIASSNASNVVKANLNLDISTRKAVRLTEKMVEEADLILTMTEYIKDTLIYLLPKESCKIYTLNQYIGVKGEISDPYGGDIDIYNMTFKELKKNMLLLISKLKGDNSIIK